jgi:hypothetical protein
MARRLPASSVRARRVVLLAITSAIALTVAGCGGDSESATSDTTTTETVATPPPPPPAPAPPPPPPPPAATKPKPRQIVIVVDEGRPRGGIKRPKLEQGDKIVLVVRADVGEAVHIHGYDVERPVRAGKPLRIPLTVSIPGRFEVELHHPDSLLAVLEVRP